ncbi:T3SS (YopN, CesT) and YbjN peptide-binding chaperone 1 [Gordonia alkaliphila]|uniref:TY-Chap central domain-containing protein n=1 Tax=Gordonia alkaliphila TaxID=1053547 RepID=A0ABP8ZK42_9ACTN
MSNLDATKMKVQRILAENLNGVELTEAGFTVRNGTTRAFITCSERDNGNRTYVRVQVPLLMQVRPSPELFEYIAFHAAEYMFGTVHLMQPADDGTSILMFEHTLLGDYLDEEELLSVVFGLAQVGDEIDEELQAKFGGKRFHED